MIFQAKLAIYCHLDSLAFIKKNKMKKFFLLPGFINLLIFAIFIYLARVLSSELFDTVKKFISTESYKTILFYLVKVAVYLIIFIVYYLAYKATVLIAISPFLAYISEKTEVMEKGIEFNFGVKDNIRFIWRGIKISIKCFFKEISITIFLLLLGFIPLLGIVSTALIFLLQSYYVGYSFMDYTLERHNFNSKSSLKFAKKNCVFLTVSGMIFTLLFFIPVFGMFFAPAISSVAVTLGTIKKLSGQT